MIIQSAEGTEEISANLSSVHTLISRICPMAGSYYTSLGHADTSRTSGRLGPHEKAQFGFVRT